VGGYFFLVKETIPIITRQKEKISAHVTIEYHLPSREVLTAQGKQHNPNPPKSAKLAGFCVVIA